MSPSGFVAHHPTPDRLVIQRTGGGWTGPIRPTPVGNALPLAVFEIPEANDGNPCRSPPPTLHPQGKVQVRAQWPSGLSRRLPYLRDCSRGHTSKFRSRFGRLNEPGLASR